MVNIVAESNSMGNAKCDSIRRHYKKDSRFLLDLYTLTYDEGETLTSRDIQVSLGRLLITVLFMEFVIA